MRQLIIAAAVAICALSVPQARAEVFHTGRTLKPGAFSVGIEPQAFLFSPPQGVLNLHGGVGFVEGLDGALRLTLPLPGSYMPYELGGNLEFQALADTSSSPAISVSIGAHSVNWQYFELDGTLMVSKVLRRVEPYLALDLDLSLPPNQVLPYMRIVPGLNVHLSRISEIMLELGLGLPGQSSYLSAGLNFYI